MIKESKKTAWCPGCGNFPLRTALKDAFNELELKSEEIAMFTGIGQAAKMPHYLNVNGFNGLHGRSLPPAIGMRIANHKINVIVESGDGCSYGEGGNHILHNIRRNPDLVQLVHDNQIYGLTKGQASPTTEDNLTTKVQPHGVNSEPFNPIKFALSMGASFVARAFVGKRDHLKKLIKAAINHRGYAIIDILQPCVSFNKLNTYQWYNKRVYELDNHDEKDYYKALKLSEKWGDEIPIGVFYKKEKATFRDNLSQLDEISLVDKKTDLDMIEDLMEEFK